MKFLGTIVYIYQKQIVQNQVLDKIIFIKTFLIGNQKILNLESSNLSNHIHILAVSICQQNILQLMIIEHFKELAAIYHLTVRRRFHEGLCRSYKLFCIRKCRDQNFSLYINHT